MKIEFSTRGTDTAAKMLTTLGYRAGHMQPVWEVIARSVQAEMQRQFASQGTFLGGSPWPELSEDWKKRKQKQGLDPRILQATSVLRNSLVRRRDPGHYERLTKDEFSYGSRVLVRGGYNLADIHDQGQGHMPEREIFKLRAITAYRYMGYMRDFIAGDALTRRRIG